MLTFLIHWRVLSTMFLFDPLEVEYQWFLSCHPHICAGQLVLLVVDYWIVAQFLLVVDRVGVIFGVGGLFCLVQ